MNIEIYRTYDGTFLSYNDKSGNIANVKTNNIRAKKKKKRIRKVGIYELFSVWDGMLSRCFDKNNKSYSDYGGRGITVYEKWQNNYKAFCDDLGKRPKGYTLERINTNGNYEPSNCKWASVAEQNINKRTSKRWFIKGKMFKSARSAAEYFNVSQAAIVKRCKLKTNCYSTPLYTKKETWI